jgi:hypothetical protein
MLTTWSYLTMKKYKKHGENGWKKKKRGERAEKIRPA